MPASKKIIVSIPEALLAEMEKISSDEGTNRSEIIRDAIKLYLGERRKKSLREQMMRGYVEMGEINRSIAEEGLSTDHETWQNSIEKLVE